MKCEVFLPQLAKERTGDSSGCPAHEQICIVGLVMVAGCCEVRDQGPNAGDNTSIPQVEEAVEEVGREIAMAGDLPDPQHSLIT